MRALRLLFQIICAAVPMAIVFMALTLFGGIALFGGALPGYVVAAGVLGSAVGGALPVVIKKAPTFKVGDTDIDARDIAPRM